MNNQPVPESRDDLVPRRLDLRPTPKSHLEKFRTRHQHFSVENQVHPGWSSYASQCHILDVAIDPFREWIWLATWGGVLCWDPKTQHCIRHTSAHGLAGNATCCILVDQAGIIWVGGKWGELCSLRLDAHTGWQLTPCVEGWRVLKLAMRPECGVYVILQASDGQCVLGEIASPDHDLHVIQDSGLSIKAADALYMDEDGVLWLGNPWGLHRHSDSGVISFEFVDEARTRIHVSAIVPNPSGWLWIGTRRGLYRFQEGQKKPFSREDLWPRDAVDSLAIEPDSGDLWCLTAREVGRLYDGAWQTTFQKPAGRLNKLVTVQQDFQNANSQSPVCLAEGQVWLGSDSGLYRIGLDSYEEAFRYAVEDVMSNAVQALWADDTGVWVGAARGFYRFDGENWQNYSQEAPDLLDVRAITSGQAPGQLWIGSWRMGLQRLQQGVYIPDEILSQPIVALVAGVNGTTWGATIDAVYWQSKDNHRWQPLPRPIMDLIGGSIIQTICHQLAPAPGGGKEPTLWVGTSAGLFYYVMGREEWNEIVELRGFSVQALTVDPLTNCLWVGTSEGLFSESTWECCHDGNILALAFSPVPAGTLWLGTAEGLEVWSSSGEIERSNVQPVSCFTALNSGLAADRVTALAVRVVDNQQEIWIGSPNGVSCYRPHLEKERQ